MGAIGVTRSCVVVGGWGMPAKLMLPWCHEAGFRVVQCVDVNTAASVTAFADQVVRAVSAPVSLVGWSLGGQVATVIADRHPTVVNELITVASNPHFVAAPDWPGMEPIAFEMFQAGLLADSTLQWQRFRQLLVKGAEAERARYTELRAQVPAPVFAENILRHTLAWLADLDTRDLLARLSMPVTHHFFSSDALVPVRLVQRIEHDYAQHRVLVSPGAHWPANVACYEGGERS